MSPRDLNESLEENLFDLQLLLDRAQVERERLEAAVEEARRLRIAVQPQTLELIESLANAEALADAARLAAVAAQMPANAGLPDDLFTGDERVLAINTLAAQGHSAAEISRRLGLPLGEVELLLSARPAS